MNLRILAVEDKQRHYDNLISILKAISDKDKLDWGIDDLLFRRAESSSEAVTELKHAVDHETFFHVLILDLEIPIKPGGIPHQEHGFEVLNVARKLGAARQIMIYTVHPSDINILKALRGGANDFVDKPTNLSVGDQELQTRFMGCWQRVLANEGASLLEQRIKDLIPYAEAGLAHRFTACFSDFVQTVAHTAEDIEHYAHERFGLDREKDPQDYLMRCLKKQDSEIRKAQENWASLKADLSNSDESPKTELLETLVDAIHDRLAPCLLVKNVSFMKDSVRSSETKLMSFQNDVRVVMQEIVAGALSFLPDYGDKHTVKITEQVRNGQAEIQFSDNIDRVISSDDSQAINGGFSVSPDHERARFGRAWGLSVAQHIALRGGGRLIVKRQSATSGNVITYFVPLA